MRMSPLERLKRRNLDYLLIETIKQIGVSNYSLIARMTGINTETVRYKINNQLGRFGLSIQINPNYSELGLSFGILHVKATISSSISWLDEASYLCFAGKVMGSENYICTFAIPYRFKKKYNDLLQIFKNQRLIQEFEIRDALWFRYPPFRSEFYDFDERRWKVDWKKIDTIMNESGASSTVVNRDADVDFIDLKILKQMQLNPTISLTKIAHDIQANPRTVRYHHSEHVVKRRYVLNNNVRWSRPFTEGRVSEVMQCVISFISLKQDDVALARKLMNKIPFTWLEVGAGDNSYYSFLDIPINDFHETVRYIESHCEQIREKLAISILDSSRSRSFPIPDEMFDPRRGWTLPGYRKEIGDESQRESVQND